VHGPERALAVVDAIDLPRYHLHHAVRADFLRRLGRNAEAAVAYGEALKHCRNESEREFLMRRNSELAGDS
jgi:RNA polymerase sigma-70 factor (ECF subfamily)